MRHGHRVPRIVGLPLAALLAGSALVAVPVDAATTVPCSMTVDWNRTANDTYANGVERIVYQVNVTSGGKSQTATVQLMVMPNGAQPRLITRKLGALGQLRTQLDSKQGARGIAAVNGDFFYDYRIGGETVYLPRNASVSHGNPVRMNIERTRVVGIDKNGKPYDGEVGVTGSVTRGTSIFAVTSVNWHEIGAADVAIYTPAWADVGVAKRPAAAVEWVVYKGKITQVRTGQGVGKTVAARTKVVAFGKNFAAAAKRARVGNVATVATQQATSTGTPLREAVGRGVRLVHAGGVAFSCSPAMTQPRPRTTIGWTAAGQWMTLTLPGTGYDRYGYRIGGLGLAQEANVAKAFGFVEAVELDGGGSTTAFIRRADRDWDRVDDPDYLYQRPIPNALVFVRPKH